MAETTIEWFGATTFRLHIRGVIIFLDAWLDRPSTLPTYLAVDDVSEADYIFISHAHFDHMPGADRIAIKTGAIVIGNCEAINCLRQAGVPEEQLLPVAGGERIPLFTTKAREKAKHDARLQAPRLPGGPIFPRHTLAALSVHVWPSLHCLMPQDHPEIMDTGTVYTGAATPFMCTLDITLGMKHGLLQLGKLLPPTEWSDGQRAFIEYIADRERNVFSHCDGGQIMYNFLIDGRALLWSAHLGGYEGILRYLEPKPDIAIIGIAGRANFNGRPFNGSAAEFALKKIKWLDSPKRVIWCLHDESCIPPYRIDTTAATVAVEKETQSRILDLKHATPTVLDL